MASSALKILPNIERLSSRVIRVLAQNPGMMTLQGTNTYIVGTGNRRVLIDSGEGHADYVPFLRQALHDARCQVQQLFLTHWHGDHVEGVPDVFDLCPGVSITKFPCTEHDKPFQTHQTKEDIRIAPARHDDIIQVEGATLRIIHTPGHTEDHVALWLEEEEAIFSGDCVLGQGTAVFEDLHEYMKSLSVLSSLQPRLIYPGHGPVVENASSWLDHYISHRNEREQQILSAVTTSNEPLTAMAIVKVVYKDTPEHLHIPAEVNVSHHLKKLLKEGKIVSVADGTVKRWTSKM